MDTTNTDALIPDPYASNEQYERYNCLDIRGLENTELEEELYALRPHLYRLPEGCWIRERVILLNDELIHRENIGLAPSKPPKPKLLQGVKP